MSLPYQYLQHAAYLLVLVFFQYLYVVQSFGVGLRMGPIL